MHASLHCPKSLFPSLPTMFVGRCCFDVLCLAFLLVARLQQCIVYCGLHHLTGAFAHLFGGLGVLGLWQCVFVAARVASIFACFLCVVCLVESHLSSRCHCCCGGGQGQSCLWCVLCVSGVGLPTCILFGCLLHFPTACCKHKHNAPPEH